MTGMNHNYLSRKSGSLTLKDKLAPTSVNYKISFTIGGFQGYILRISIIPLSPLF